MQGFIGLKGYKEFVAQSPAARVEFLADVFSLSRAPDLAGPGDTGNGVPVNVIARGMTGNGKVWLLAATETGPLGNRGALVLGVPDGDGATNEPLPQNAQGMPVYSGGYALVPMLHHPQGEIVFIMAFSGGGERSAAFAHGVLRGLRQIPVVEDGRTRSLLDELDYVGAVSGGSFPAMHYGLYRDKSFDASDSVL
jgi:hypothetical protein